MNTVIGILLVFVIIFAIYLAFVSFSLDYLIQDSNSLNVVSTIPAGSLDSPASPRYFYEGWFYIKTNVPVTQENVLFRRGSDFVVSMYGSTLNIWAPTTTSECSFDETNNKFIPGPTDASNNKIASIPNFPYQKWAQLVINVDSNRVDVYVDGQFVQSATSPSPIGSVVNNPIIYGTKFIDGRVARFRRPAININPQGVWQSYIKGSGQGESVSDYHLNLKITKNKAERFNKRLF